MCSLDALAEETKIQGRLQNRTGFRLDNDQTRSLSDNLAQIELQQPIGTWEIKAIGRARRESDLEPEVYREAELRELTLRQRAENYTLTLGRQQVVWGRTDGLRVLDLVNPLDMREFILDDYSDSRIPLWMVNAEWFIGKQTLQVLVIPDIKQNRAAEYGGEYYIAPDLPMNVPVSTAPTRTPAKTLANSEYAARWGGRAGQWDLAGIYFYGWGDTPVPFTQLEAGPSLLVSPEVRRQRVFGLSGDRPIGPTVFRFEVSASPDSYQSVATADGGNRFVRHDIIRYAFGVDWLVNNWLLSSQIFHENIRNPQAGLTGDDSRNFFTLLISHKWLQDRLGARLFYVYGPEHRDEWFAPRLSYDFFGRLELRIGADFFDGKPSGLFGQFADRDRIVLEAILRF